MSHVPPEHPVSCALLGICPYYFCIDIDPNGGICNRHREETGKLITVSDNLTPLQVFIVRLEILADLAWAEG